MTANLVRLLSLVLVAAASAASADEPTTLKARDTLGELTDQSEDAKSCLANFAWKPVEFDVRIEGPSEKDRKHGYDKLVRFPTPFPNGDANNDSVSMEWYRPKDKDGTVQRAPAVVVIHESGSSMPAGRAIARGLRSRGWHAVLLHLPYYGHRRTGGKRPEVVDLVGTMKQGMADARRAGDAVAVLPDIDPSHIALQGTSLGGFVAATAASLDCRYDSVYIMLAGGNLYDLFQNGKQDTEKIRKKLDEAGLTGEKLKKLLDMVEPTRVVHRLDPKRTWLYSALQDDVVPIANARALAKSARLEPEHHIQLIGGHYTAALYLPGILDHMSQQLKSLSRPSADTEAGRD